MEKKHKILFCLPAFTFGGTVFSTLNMISFLKKDYDVYVLPMTYQGPVIKRYLEFGINLLPEDRRLSAMMGRIKDESGIKNKLISFIHKALRKVGSKINYPYEALLFRRIAMEIEKKYEFDFVASCQEGGSTYFASYFTKAKKIAWFRSEYSVYRNQLLEKDFKHEKEIYNNFDKIICVSNVTKKDFNLFFPSLTNKTFAIHNIQFTDLINDLSLEKISDFSKDNSFKIVSVGRFAPQKKFSYIPKIAAALKRKGLDFTWYIIGDGNHGGEYDKTISELQIHKVSNEVQCIGSRLNPYPYIRQADLIVVPSYYEACPRVVIESKILHTPVICADFSSAKEFVENGVDGYVAPIDQLSKYIGTLIEDKNEYEAIKHKCNEYKIDNDKIYLQLKDIFS